MAINMGNSLLGQIGNMAQAYVTPAETKTGVGILDNSAAVRNQQNMSYYNYYKTGIEEYNAKYGANIPIRPPPHIATAESVAAERAAALQKAAPVGGSHIVNTPYGNVQLVPGAQGYNANVNQALGIGSYGFNATDTRYGNTRIPSGQPTQPQAFQANPYNPYGQQQQFAGMYNPYGQLPQYGQNNPYAAQNNLVQNNPYVQAQTQYGQNYGQQNLGFTQQSAYPNYYHPSQGASNDPMRNINSTNYGGTIRKGVIY